MVKSIYANAKAQIRTADGISESFSIEKSVLQDYTTEIFDLKPNTVEWLTFEKKLHNIPGDARKKMNRLTGLAGNSTITSPEFSCSNSYDSETRVEEYLNLVGEN
ncbi:hypothetical protein Fcan01_28649 [Folsomia candida]|uniref:Uncharacterized protein n=1 Tax=Folsomia candida TaxID=158441 RepID=A0A226CVR7_FOLCA|nr:hypothetical protein Fcan01_28649 [Folsomia candida]